MSVAAELTAAELAAKNHGKDLHTEMIFSTFGDEVEAAIKFCDKASGSFKTAGAD